MKARLLIDRSADRPEDYADTNGIVPAGTIIAHPQAFRLVQLGIAEPVDEECQQRANMTAEQLQQARYAAQRLSAGIHPYDFEAYDAGIMLGYAPDGTWIPGPNYAGEDFEISDVVDSDEVSDDALTDTIGDDLDVTPNQSVYEPFPIATSELTSDQTITNSEASGDTSPDVSIDDER